MLLEQFKYKSYSLIKGEGTYFTTYHIVSIKSSGRRLREHFWEPVSEASRLGLLKIISLGILGPISTDYSFLLLCSWRHAELHECVEM